MTMLHPHHYTLSLLQHLLAKADHTLFPQDRLEEMKKEYAQTMGDHEVPQVQVEQMASKFGREIWPYHEALEELYRRHGKSKEEERVREKLNPQLKEKYDRFLTGGGSLNDFRRGAELEMYFTPEEKFEIGTTVVDAHHAVLQEIASSCRLDLRSECEEVINDHKQKIERIEKKLTLLKDLASRSEKWRPEIEDKVKTLEEAFGYLERTFHESDLDGAIDYYEGVIESPEFV